MADADRPMIVRLPEPVAAIYKAVAELDSLYAKYRRKFTPDGHLVGSIGEVIAAEALGLELEPPGTKGHDAIDSENRKVQIKMTAGVRIGLYSNCQRLVVLRVIDPGWAKVEYDGPGQPAWDKVGPEQKNGQSYISLEILRSLPTKFAYRNEWPPSRS